MLFAVLHLIDTATQESSMVCRDLDICTWSSVLGHWDLFQFVRYISATSAPNWNDNAFAFEQAESRNRIVAVRIDGPFIDQQLASDGKF